MSELIIKQKLDQLAAFQAQREALNAQKQKLIDDLLPPEIKARIQEIESEFGDKLSAVDSHITQLDSDVRAEILQHGVSVKASYLHAIWSHGRVAWDTEALDKYARTHPEIKGFRKQGNPFVTIRQPK